MKDTTGKSASLHWDDHVVPMTEAAPTNGKHSNWDEETRPHPPLSNLFQYNMIMSPSHEDEEEGKAPVVGEIMDFDEHVSPKFPRKVEDIQEVSDEEDSKKKPAATPKTTINEEMKEDDVVSVEESVLDIAMFEGVLQESNEEDQLEDETCPLPAMITIDTAKRNFLKPDEPRPVKKAKTAAAPTPVASENKIAAEGSKMLPPKRRPRCLFINHFGTRLNDKGQAVRVNVPAKHHTPTRISSEESVSIKTKSTGRSSRYTDADSKKTPVTRASTASNPSTSGVPLVVRIVTPNKKKPISSSCLEDITMEEDELEPIKHDNQAENGDDALNSSHIPYINSISKTETRTPTPPGPAAATRMMAAPGMMTPGPGGMPLNFARPFPLLQRRAFLAGSYPMVPHPFAAGPGWPHPHFPAPGMVFNPQLASFAGRPTPPPTSSALPAQTQSQFKKS